MREFLWRRDLLRGGYVDQTAGDAKKNGVQDVGAFWKKMQAVLMRVARVHPEIRKELISAIEEEAMPRDEGWG